MDSDDDWKKPEYKNWVRGAKGLEYLQKGLQNDVAKLVLRHRDQIVQTIASSVHGPHSQCNLCSDNNLLPEHAVRNNCRNNCIQRKSANCFGSRRTHRRVCPNGICSKLYDEIVNSHRHKDPMWTNTDPSTWCSDPAGWSFAKCFQTTPCPGTSSSETDAAGLLSIILSDTFFQTKVTCNLAAPNNYFSVARKIRNGLLHSPKMELDDAKLQDYINTFIAVLQDRMFTDDMSREAVQSLVQLKNNEITISLSEEVKLVQVRKEALCALEQLQKKEQEVVTKLETQSQEALIKIKEAELSTLDKIDKHEIHQRVRQKEETIQHLPNTIQQLKKEKASGRQIQSPETSTLSGLPGPGRREKSGILTKFASRIKDLKQRLLARIAQGHELRKPQVFEAEMDAKGPDESHTSSAETMLKTIFEEVINETGPTPIRNLERENQSRLTKIIVLFLEGINSNGGQVCDVETKCIVIKMRCSSCRDMLKLVQYFESSEFVQLLRGTEQILNAICKCEFHITFEITEACLKKIMDSLEMLSQEETEKDFYPKMESEMPSMEETLKVPYHEMKSEMLSLEETLKHPYHEMESGIPSKEETEKPAEKAYGEMKTKMLSLEETLKHRYHEMKSGIPSKEGTEKSAEKAYGEMKTKMLSMEETLKVPYHEMISEMLSLEVTRKHPYHEMESEMLSLKETLKHPYLEMKSGIPSKEETEKPAEKAYGEMKTKILSLEETLKHPYHEMKSGIPSKEGTEKSAEKAYGEMKTKMLSLEETLKHPYHEMESGIPSKEEKKSAEKAYDKMKTNLQDDLISFYKRQHKNIPLSPLMEESQPLLKFYKMPGIQSVKVTRSRDGDRPEKTPVTTLWDVFYKEDKLCSNIYLTADAGYGKTAFSKKLALAWCQAKQRNESEDEHFSDDEITVMSEFRFVFLVLLRDSSNECDLDKLILNQICSKLEYYHMYSLENLKDILHEEACLVILDGLDEWTHPLSSCRQGVSNIPHQKARENIAVLTTTRPWKFSVIGLHSSQIDQKLELEGLSNDSAKKLKRSVISHLHGEQEKGKIDKYEKEFNMTVQDSHKSDLTAIPLFLMYLLFLWYYKINVGKTLAGLYSSFIELLLSRTVNKDGIQIPKTETVQSNIPPCLDNNTLCNQFYTLLTTLGKLALHTLCSETKENTLVFDGCIAEKYLRKDELTFCLKTGIITQSKVQGVSLLQQKTKVSFAHKTMQEFLAALYINSAPDQKSVQEIVLSKCKCVKDILDMSKVFMFIVSISGNFSFSRELMKIINEDEITKEYRSSLQDWSFHPLKDLQDMYILCCKEIPRENEVNICLQDVIIDRSCEQEEYRENLKQLTTRNKQNIRSVYINMYHMKDTPYNTARKVIDYFSLSDLENIEKIHYKLCEYSDYILHLLNSSVKSLYLSCEYRQPGSWSRSLFDKVTSLQKLEAIKISEFNMSHSELRLLLDFISQRDCLREIVLEELSCTDHEWSPWTGLSIDLSRHSSLRKLTLRGLNLSQVIINMASLENCRLGLSNQDLVLKFLNCADNKLNTFDFGWLESSAAIDEMLRMLRESRHVRKVNLSFINLGRRILRLSPDCVNIEYLTLYWVSMKAAELEELLDFVLKLKQTVTVDILGRTISASEEFETLRGKIKTSQRVRILEDEKDWFKFVTIKDGD